MKEREHHIEIDELVLTGAPAQALIEAELLRALRDAGVTGAVGERIPASVAREVTRSVGNAVKGGGV
ncbi:MAG TPA: hypothetical protein VNY05_14905 [Candidatus Acidoferrales bacterium]|jgi:hypothetical protein|nr:hypothetical protein [Candidatus Acidoferrales bacterium]